MIKPTERKFVLKRDKIDERDKKFLRITEFPVKMPKKFDLTFLCPPVFDQGNLGSCTANAGVAAYMMLKYKREELMSRLFLYYQERLLYGTEYLNEDCGAEMRDIGKCLKTVGVCLEKYMPYEEEKFAHTPSMQAYLDAKDRKIKTYTRLSTLDQIKWWLVTHEQPVLIGMDCYGGEQGLISEYAAKNGKISCPKNGDQYYGGHAVLIVGYKDATLMGKMFGLIDGYLLVRNSWGKEWGAGGYFWMPYDYVRRDFAYDIWTLS